MWRRGAACACSKASRALSGSSDNAVRLWDVETGRCLRVLEGHTATVHAGAWSADHRCALSGSSDKTVRLWSLETGRCLRVLEGHTGSIYSVAWSADQRRAFSGDIDGCIRVWDLEEFVTEARAPEALAITVPPALDQFQYANAKVLIVGDTSSGKTGLAHRLATGHWKPSDGSTLGAWSTQWKLDAADASPGVEREIWLWDFGGQADQRLIHQLYMDRSALILLLFNADQEDVFPGLRDWLTALGRCVPLYYLGALPLIGAVPQGLHIADSPRLLKLCRVIEIEAAERLDMIEDDLAATPRSARRLTARASSRSWKSGSV
jgi:WD40 repeat protein